MNALDTATAPLVEIMVEAGMPLEGAAALALTMRQVLTEQPKVGATLLTALATGQTDLADSIAHELIGKSGQWLADHPDEVAEIFTA